MNAIAIGARGGRGAIRRRHAATANLRAAFCLCLAAAGLALLAGADLARVAEGWRAAGWSEGEARILSLSLADDNLAPGRADPRRLISVEYAYAVGGLSYASERASLSDFGAIEDRRLVALYRDLEYARLTGRTVPVFFDPARPQDALLDRTVPPGDLRALVFGLALLLAGGCGAVSARRLD